MSRPNSKLPLRMSRPEMGWAARTLLVWTVLVGCGGAQKAVYTDPDFDDHALREGGLIVGAVVVAPSVADTTGTDDPLTLGENLRRRLSEESSLTLVGPAQALLAGDVDEYAGILDQYARSARLAAPALGALSRRRPLGRYVLLGRIDIDEVERTHEQTRYDQEDRIRFEIELLSRHHVGLSVDVFDLRDQKIVWSATFDRRLQVRVRRFTHEVLVDEVDNAPIEELQVIRDRIRELGYPTPPTRREVLAHLYGDVAEALPITN